MNLPDWLAAKRADIAAVEDWARWDHYQPNRRQVEERRRYDRERMAEWRHAKKVKKL